MSKSHSPRPLYVDPLGISRIAALSDGVFAIVITLLVFDLKVPADTLPQNLSAALMTLAPKFLSYVITFIVIGIYWVGHHAIMRHVVAYDRFFLWLHIFFLMTVSFLPFPTSLLGTYGTEQIAVVIYGVSMIAIGISLDLLWRHASNAHHLIQKSLDEKVIRLGHQRILLTPAIALCSIALSFLSARLGIALYLVASMFYFFPTRIDKLSQHSQ